MIKPEWLFKIRLELSELPDEYVSDESLYQYILKAQVFIDNIAYSDASEGLYEQAVIALSTYYAYIGYTSLVARRMGSVPEYSEERANQLKNIALKFVRLVSKYTIGDNFEIVTNEDVKPIAFGLCGTL